MNQPGLSPLSQEIRAEQKANIIRRVYELPRSLHSRIIGYQAERRLPSEAAAVRELLERALSTQNAPA